MCDTRRRIRINSAQRLPGGTPSHYRIATGLNGTRVRSITLANYAIPSSMYNVTTRNNSLKILESFGSLTLTVPVGNYNPNQLAGAIMNANALVSCTYDSLAGKFTIKLTSNQPILPVRGVGLAPMMGFDLPEDFANFKTSHLAQNVANMSRPPVLFLRLNRLIGNGVISATPDRATMAVYNDAEFGAILIGSLDKDMNEVRLNSVPVFSEWEIEWVDANGAPIDFNGIDHSLDLIVDLSPPAIITSQ